MLNSLLILLLIIATSAANGQDRDSGGIKQPIAELKLTNGVVFKNVTIVRYESERVVLKSSAGVGGISYSMIPEPLRREMLAERNATTAAQKTTTAAQNQAEQTRYNAKIAAAEEAKRARRRFEETADRGNVVVGMPVDLVIKAWGEPARKNESTSGFDQWVYYGTIRSSVRQYVYVRNGVVESITN